MYYCKLGDVTVVGSSPEALVKVNAAGRAELRPIAGTRPRAEDQALDERHERELLADVKENAEHVMLVDLARNDLGRVASAGSVHVDPYRVIERYSHVMHIVSGVKGQLATGRDAFDLFAATFPAGTLVGAPKVRAMEIIDELEPVRRGLYGGTVGYFGARGDMDQAITIRTLVFRGDEYSYQAGAGIVADSVPAAEYRRSDRKIRCDGTRAQARVGGLMSVPGTLLLIDNYDSFTYNLVQAFMVLGAEVDVRRNDAITVEEAKAVNPTHLCISPGPGTPYDAGVSMDMIRAFAGTVPVFGVCLGHQSIVEVFGGKVVRAGRLMHGKTSPVEHDGKGLFTGIPQSAAGRPLSLVDRQARHVCRPSSKSPRARPRARSWACVTGR